MACAPLTHHHGRSHRVPPTLGWLHAAVPAPAHSGHPGWVEVWAAYAVLSLHRHGAGHALGSPLSTSCGVPRSLPRGSRVGRSLPSLLAGAAGLAAPRPSLSMIVLPKLEALPQGAPAARRQTRTALVAALSPHQESTKAHLACCYLQRTAPPCSTVALFHCLQLPTHLSASLPTKPHGGGRCDAAPNSAVAQLEAAEAATLSSLLRSRGSWRCLHPVRLSLGLRHFSI